MALFRGRQPDASIWRRFRSGLDSFTFTEEEGHFTAHVVATAERVVDLVHALSEELPPAVDVAMEDLRTGRVWRGERLALPDVRETLARLKIPLATYAGVEVAVYTGEDQLTLTAELELYIYARTDRWLYLLLGKGLLENDRVSGHAWRLRREDLDPAPELTDVLARAAEQIGLPET